MHWILNIYLCDDVLQIKIQFKISELANGVIKMNTVFSATEIETLNHDKTKHVFVILDLWIQLNKIVHPIFYGLGINYYQYRINNKQ